MLPKEEEEEKKMKKVVDKGEKIWYHSNTFGDLHRGGKTEKEAMLRAKL